jgi:iron complex transport system permease protein
LGIAPQDIMQIIAARLGLIDPGAIDPTSQAVFETIRAPRIVLGFLAGAALALSGAALQGVFRNPLADPGLIGVSPGAALGAVGVIVLGPSMLADAPAALQGLMLPIAAFICGLAVTALVYVAARHDGRVIASSMLLAGVAASAIAMAGIGWLSFLASDDQLRLLTFWTLGSLGGASWPILGPTAILIAAASIALLSLPRSLDALAFGEDAARHLGFEPSRTTLIAAFAAAVAVGAATRWRVRPLRRLNSRLAWSRR